MSGKHQGAGAGRRGSKEECTDNTDGSVTTEQPACSLDSKRLVHFDPRVLSHLGASCFYHAVPLNIAFKSFSAAERHARSTSSSSAREDEIARQRAASIARASWSFFIIRLIRHDSSTSSHPRKRWRLIQPGTRLRIRLSRKGHQRTTLSISDRNV